MKIPDNTQLRAKDSELIDETNSEFYSRFPYPWSPVVFPKGDRSDFETIMLNQSVGDFTQCVIPLKAKIWVAGCGTNQAIYTALKFPEAKVIGSDISPLSLEVCRKNANCLKIENLELKQESLNHVDYRDEFDYILSTGVIHHNADPSRPLANIAKALRPNGILELMVYNKFHRKFHASFQGAIRILADSQIVPPTMDEQLHLARLVLESEPAAGTSFAMQVKEGPEAQFADMLIQPLEYSYTVDTLHSLIGACGLELILPCGNQFDYYNDRSWFVNFSAEELRDKVSALKDVTRWQFINFLLMENSPMLWFFVGHQGWKGCEYYQQQVNDDFLGRRFARASTRIWNYVRNPQDSVYRCSPIASSYPPRPRKSAIENIISRVDGKTTMYEILSKLGVDTTDTDLISDIRMHTTTTTCPYLLSV
ncbi:MAG TPA: class I SAM-dependent methyltransferase [Edaphobacter sp.]|nr:class I SAM-dependent methyltransferase [Edaphobacter sp.]